jgi:hypothetical protein
MRSAARARVEIGAAGYVLNDSLVDQLWTAIRSETRRHISQPAPVEPAGASGSTVAASGRSAV